MQVHILTLIGLLAASGFARADNALAIEAQPLRAVVAARSPRAPLIALPDMEFTISLRWHCAGEARSLALSVADTLQSLNGAELAENQPAQLTIRVPARQLKLAAQSAFCVADDPDTTTELDVPGLATAQASLHCDGEPGPAVLFASTPLPAVLVCDRPPGGAQESPAPR